MSDHNPQDVEGKRLPFAEAAPGAIGLETMLPAGLRLVHNGELELKTLIRAMSTRPAEILGLPGGTLRAGAPADVIVIDPDVRPGWSIPPISNRPARTPRSTRPALQAAWCGPSSAGGRSLSMSGVPEVALRRDGASEQDHAWRRSSTWRCGHGA